MKVELDTLELFKEAIQNNIYNLSDFDVKSKFKLLILIRKFQSDFDKELDEIKQKLTSEMKIIIEDNDFKDLLKTYNEKS